MTVNDIIFQLLREALFSLDDTLVKKTNECNAEYAQEVSTEDTLKDHDLWERVFDEMVQQTVLGLTAPVVSHHKEIPEDIRSVWSGQQRAQVIRYVQKAEMQKRTCEILQSAGIPVAVIKGMAAAIYYPIPEIRMMGDIDLLVKPEDYETAKKILRENGYAEKIKNDKYHTAYIKYNILIELHQSPAGLHRTENAKAIHDFILSGMGFVETNEIGQERFPILPWKQNGMELIWHIRQHLYNGLGLRQIIDWMMFVNYYLNDVRMQDYMPDLKKCGLDQLAITVTKMCQKYLGLPHENITWCDEADETICEELMDFIMSQGNFGVKATDEKTAKVVSGYGTPKQMLNKLQERGKAEWALLQKVPVLSPIAFVYAGMKSVFDIIRQKGGLKKAIADLRLGQKRKRMLSALYGERKGGKIRFFKKTFSADKHSEIEGCRKNKRRYKRRSPRHGRRS